VLGRMATCRSEHGAAFDHGAQYFTVRDERFPCNQFLGQEPGSAEEIQTLCWKNYGVTFDLFDKVEVNGENACDLYKLLRAQSPLLRGEVGLSGPGEGTCMIERRAKSLVFATEARRHPYAPTKAHVQTQLLGNRNRHGL
jgi:hypothetical protein